MTFNGNFVEPFSIFGKDGWPHKHASREIVMEGLKNLDKKKYYQDILQIFKKSKRLRGGRDYEEWISIMNKNSNLSPDDLYIQIAKLYQSELLGFRWNQCLFYANIWLQKSNNHYWTMVVRNPLDRSVSAMKTHQWSFRSCLRAAESYASKYEIISKMFPDRFLTIHYEDIIDNPEYEMKQFFEKINMTIDDVELKNLKGPNMDPYRSEGWRTSKTKGSHRKGEGFSRFYSKSIGQYKEILNKKQIGQICQVMNNDLYGRYL